MKSCLATLLWVALAMSAAQAAHTPPPAAQAALERAQALDERGKPAEALIAYMQAIEADPELLAAHDGLIKARLHVKEVAYEHKDPNRRSELEQLNQRIDAKYRDWDHQYPNSVGILYGMAAQLYDRHDARARTYLLKLAARDPKNAQVYKMLGGDARTGGDTKAAAEYLRKASELEPMNAEYAYAYARALEPPQREAAIFDVIKRFPNSDSTAEALFWLGIEAPDDPARIRYFEQLRTQFPPDRSVWSAEAMEALFDVYIPLEPTKAVELARQMRVRGKSSKEWEERRALAGTYVAVNRRLAAGQPTAALALLQKLKPDPDSSNAALLARIKAQVMIQAGELQQGYTSLLKLQATSPEDETLQALQSAGRHLNRSPAQVQADLDLVRKARAKLAPAFDLQQYASDETVSLAKLRGKVVLLTFWFPACSWCRLEFPHLEATLKQLHRQDVVYLGVNVSREEDAYVLPLLEKMQYTFTPLKGTDAVLGTKTGYKVQGTPANFLIDRSGHIAYSGFVASDVHGELMVRRMIESVL